MKYEQTDNSNNLSKKKKKPKNVCKYKQIRSVINSLCYLTLKQVWYVGYARPGQEYYNVKLEYNRFRETEAS